MGKVAGSDQAAWSQTEKEWEHRGSWVGLGAISQGVRPRRSRDNINWDDGKGRGKQELTT